MDENIYWSDMVFEAWITFVFVGNIFAWIGMGFVVYFWIQSFLYTSDSMRSMAGKGVMITSDAVVNVGNEIASLANQNHAAEAQPEPAPKIRKRKWRFEIGETEMENGKAMFLKKGDKNKPNVAENHGIDET
ncbi:unnamed protein product [Orchesella dallaii]|uniref:Uncharacterized protein n=1 Tax=Orchesella dallaii TaxID=48710 RepID=A0ABP1QK37_9HEXA